MRFSIVVCTYGRARSLEHLLGSLSAQTYRNFEVLVVDGNQDSSTVQTIVAASDGALDVRHIPSPKGLTRQRNVGIEQSRGDVLCFLDDDVTMETDFLSRVKGMLETSGMHDVGGLTGYDVLNYPSPVTLRWKLRWFLGAIPSLNPGDADHLGRAVPVSFMTPYSGCRSVKWLSGFCMIYRRTAIGALRFDEKLPTYGGEDRDFSAVIGGQWRLLLCGDLHLQHHCTKEGRDSEVDRVFETGFGTGRRFAKYARTPWDYVIVARSFLGDLVVDILAFLAHPSRYSFLTTFARVSGFFHGLTSLETAHS
ncbi:MAG: glycosyltransferase [Acidobacteriia bacterium]|nr:glycosyltransferase [Terriglobia bacterium]